MADENLLAALRRERAGYLARGLPDKAQGVTDELVKLGAEDAAVIETPEPAPTEKAVPRRPK